MGLLAYWKDGWNKFDCILVVITLGVDLAMRVVQFSGGGSTSATSLRFVRLSKSQRAVRVMKGCRVFRVLSRCTSTFVRMKKLIYKTLLALPTVVSIFELIALLYMLYAIIGVEAFHRAPDGVLILEGEAAQNYTGGFQSIPEALLSLFQVLCQAGWHFVMLMEFEVHGVGGPFVYFFTFNVLVIFVLKALVSSLIWEVYLIATESETRAKAETNNVKRKDTQMPTEAISSSEQSSHDDFKDQVRQMDNGQKNFGSFNQKLSNFSSMSATPAASHDISPGPSSLLPSPPNLSPQQRISIRVKSPMRNDDFSLACNLISRNPTNLSENGGGFSSSLNHKKDLPNAIFEAPSSGTSPDDSVNNKTSQDQGASVENNETLLNIPVANGQFQIQETFGRVMRTELEQEDSKEEGDDKFTPRLRGQNSSTVLTGDLNSPQGVTRHYRGGSQLIHRPFSTKAGSSDMSTEQTRVHSRVGSTEVKIFKGFQTVQDENQSEEEKIEEYPSQESYRSEGQHPEQKFKEIVTEGSDSLNQLHQFKEYSPINNNCVPNISASPKSRNQFDQTLQRPSKSRISPIALDNYYHGDSSAQITVQDYAEDLFYALTPRDHSPQQGQLRNRTGHLRIPRFESGSSGLTRILLQSTKMHSVDCNVEQNRALPSIIFKYGRFSVNAQGFPHMLSESDDPQSELEQQQDEDGDDSPRNKEEEEFKDNDLALNKGIILKQALMQQRNVFKMREAQISYFTENYGQYYFKLESICDGMRLKSRDTITAPQMLSLQLANLLSSTFKAFSELRNSPFLRMSPSSSIIDTKGPYMALITNLQKVLRETEALCPYASVAHLCIQVKRLDQPNAKPKWLLPFQRRSYHHGANRLKLKKHPSVALANDLINLLEAALAKERKAGLLTSRTPVSLDTPAILNNGWRGGLNLRERQIESIYKEQQSGLEFALLPHFFQICKENPKVTNSAYQLLRKVGKKCQSQFSRVSRRHYFWNTVCLPLFDGLHSCSRDEICSNNGNYQQFEVTDAVVLLFIGQHRTLSNLSKKDVLARRMKGQVQETEGMHYQDDHLKEGSLQIGLQMDKITEFMKELGDILSLHRDLLIQAAAAYIGTVVAEKRNSLRPQRC